MIVYFQSGHATRCRMTRLLLYDISLEWCLGEIDGCHTLFAVVHWMVGGYATFEELNSICYISGRILLGIKHEWRDFCRAIHVILFLSLPSCL